MVKNGKFYRTVSSKVSGTPSDSVVKGFCVFIVWALPRGRELKVLPNRVIESFWDAHWLGIERFAFLPCGRFRMVEK